MASPLRTAARNLGERLDEDLFPILLDTASLRVVDIQTDLDRWSLVWHNPAHDQAPGIEDLRRSAESVLQRSVRKATVRGGVAGLAGALAIPPETVEALIQLLHHGQRLSVIYGHNPETDAGRVWLLRALAAALEIDLPRQGRWDLRVSALRLQPVRQGAGSDRAAWLAQAVMRRAMGSIRSRLVRSVPGLSLGISALAARRNLRLQGKRMIAILESGWHAPLLLSGAIEDAIEVS